MGISKTYGYALKNSEPKTPNFSDERFWLRGWDFITPTGAVKAKHLRKLSRNIIISIYDAIRYYFFERLIIMMFIKMMWR